MIRDEFIEIFENEVRALYVGSNGKEGLELYEKHQPDVIITDIRMPLMDGLAMSKIILASNPNVPIIVSSAFNDTDYLMKAIKLGIQHYLLKPVNLQELFTTLDKAALQVLQSRRLKESEKLLTQYKDAVDKSEIVSKADSKGDITYVNEAFCKISGYIAILNQTSG